MSTRRRIRRVTSVAHPNRLPDEHADVHRAERQVGVTSPAAALLQSLVDNHALVDGNKRLGWLATAVFLELNGFNASIVCYDDVYELVIWIASTNSSLEEVTTRLSRLLARRRRR